MDAKFQAEIEHINTNLKTFDERFYDDVRDVFKYAERYARSYMKAKAPWTDRTTRARRGLQAISRYDRGAKSFSMTLFGEAPYQIYLETKRPDNGGRPILWPTAKVVGPYIMQALENILDRGVSVAGIFPAVPARSGRGGTRGMSSYGRRNRTRRSGAQTVSRSRR
jgi:hypothetical protein